MVASAHESPHRLVVAPGEIVLRDTRLVRIEARLSKSLARVLDLATGQREDVPLAALRGRAILTASIQTDQHLESSRTCSLGDEDIAVSREQILSELLDGTGDWSNRVRAITTRYSVSRRTVYRWLSRYRDVAVMSSLIPRKRGIASGTKRLDETRERLVNKLIEERYLTRSRPNVEELCRIVHRRCIVDGFEARVS